MVSAGSEVDLYNQLQTAGLELVDCSVVGANKRGALSGICLQKVQTRDLIQLFVNLEQMQSAGVPLLDALADIRDTTGNDRLRDILTEIYRDVSDGGALSESMALHPKIFHNLYISLIKAGEDTGDLSSVYRQLIKYLKWVDDMRSKVKKATTYPIIVTIVVLLVVVVMMGYVVPQIVGFLDNLDQELNIFTTSLVATSEFFANPLFHIFGFGVPGGLLVLSFPILFIITLKILRKSSDDLAYRIDAIMLSMPIAGSLIRKITIARYAQTFGALFASGIDVIGALRASRDTVTNKAMLEALEAVEKYVQSGSSLSEAFNACGEFPSLVVRMIKIGEESGNLTPVLDQVAEFYTKDVDEAVQGLITMIEPALTGVLGIVILWIAVAVFGPIYAMLETIDI
ncbi:MAG: type II secretion system F family protein [Alphaproteobacteria bacterium]|nr:type II secretion system F family protein [Alphaproteobacteria bacterium]